MTLVQNLTVKLVQNLTFKMAKLVQNLHVDGYTHSYVDLHVKCSLYTPTRFMHPHLKVAFKGEVHRNRAPTNQCICHPTAPSGSFRLRA